jgi:hypothetical protein
MRTSQDKKPSSSYTNTVDHKQASKATKAKFFKDKAREESKAKRKAQLSSRTEVVEDTKPTKTVGTTKPSSVSTVDVVPVQPVVVPQPVQPLSVPEVRQQASQLYYPGLPFEDRVAKLAQDGCTNEQIAMRLDSSLKAVMEARKAVSKATLINSPRELFAARLTDFDEAFTTARNLYFDDPSSETNYRVMTEFAKTMRELVKDYNDLEDPLVIASVVVQKALRPLVLKMLTTIVEDLKSTSKAITPFLRDNEKVQFMDGINASVKSLQAHVNNDYNKSLEVLEQIYGVSLGNLKINKNESETVK